MSSWNRYGRLLVALGVCFPTLGSAYTVEPSLVSLHPVGGESSAFLHVANKETKPVAVEVEIKEYSRDIDGKAVIGKDAGDDFIVYPAQMILMPGDEVGVQVRWIGEPVLDAERAFTLITHEVPIPSKSTDEPESAANGVRIAVTVLLNYDVRIYVAPPGAKSDVVVDTVAVCPPKEAERAASEMLEVTLANRGTAHRQLKNMSLVFVPLDAAGTPGAQ